MVVSATFFSSFIIISQLRTMSKNKIIKAAIVTLVWLSCYVSLTLNFLHPDEILDAPIVVALQSFPKTEDNALQSSSRRYLKYDDAAPKFISGTARSHTLPNAVPSSRTIPRHLTEDKLYHISQRTNFTGAKSIIRPLDRFGNVRGQYNSKHSYKDDFRTLYLYNPSVVPLHNTVTPQGAANNSTTDGDSGPDSLSRENLQSLTGGDPNVRYIATYRAYLGSNCFGPDPKREIMLAGEQVSYLAIALLDASLNVISGSDVLIDLNAGPSQQKYWHQSMEDCRVYIMRGNLYAICNEEMLQLGIRRRIEGGGFAGTRDEDRVRHVYPNLYGQGMEVVLMGHVRKVSGGKNFATFRSPSHLYRPLDKPFDTGQYDYYLQIYPMPHTYRRINIPDAKGPFTRTKPQGLERTKESNATLPALSFDTPDSWHNITYCKGGRGDDGMDDDGRNADMRKNCTFPQSRPFFGDKDHGSACCISLRLGKKEVMVGISHQKFSPKKTFWLRDISGLYDQYGRNQYVSRFVAYDTTPPFDIVARSGWFCLGFGTNEEAEREGGSSFAGKNTQYKLHLFGEKYACPAIHFISGLAEVVGDASRAIVAYGVNDCHPRMAMLEKNEIEKLLIT